MRSKCLIPIYFLAMTAACGSVKNELTTDAQTATADCAANPTGLRGRWRADMNANDDTGNSMAVTRGAIEFVPGKHGNAFQLDGRTNAVLIDDRDHLWPTASFSIEAWVNTKRAGTVVQKYQCSSACPSMNASAFWALAIDSDGHPDFGLRTNAMNDTSKIVDSLHDLRDGKWHQLVGVRDSTVMIALLYVDGSPAASANLTAAESGPMTNTDDEVDPITIGAALSAGSTLLTELLTGAVDEISFYSSAVTTDQIESIFEAPDGECHYTGTP